MRRSARAVMALGPALALALLAPAHARSPSDQYELFEAKATVIVDRFTGLAWQRDTTVAERGFGDAEAACRARGSGYRVPTHKELLTLVDEDPALVLEPGLGEQELWVDRNAFPETPGGYVWTATADPIYAGHHIAINFRSGSSQRLPDGSVGVAVRCVQSRR